MLSNFQRVSINPWVLRAMLLSMALVGAAAPAQTYFKCRNAAGEIQYSDRACEGPASTVETSIPGVTDSPERKAANDARVQREKALGDKLQADRLAREEAGRQAQDRQDQVNKTIAGQVDQERAKQNVPSPSRKVTDVIPYTTLP
jgi:hypothetical protein